MNTNLISMRQLSVSRIDQLGFASNHRWQYSTAETITSKSSFRGAIGTRSGSRRTSQRCHSGRAFVARSRVLGYPTPSR